MPRCMAFRITGPRLCGAQVGRTSVLRCETGEDVMSLLLSSERVYSDLLDWIWYGEPEQLVLREWEPDLSLDWEFRAYVHNNNLTAVSQYDHFCRYAHLWANGCKPELRRRIEELWRQLHPHVGVGSYCVDFGYLPAQDRLVMIELSPFGPLALKASPSLSLPRPHSFSQQCKSATIAWQSSAAAPQESAPARQPFDGPTKRTWLS